MARWSDIGRGEGCAGSDARVLKQASEREEAGRPGGWLAAAWLGWLRRRAAHRCEPAALLLAKRQLAAAALHLL
jgi:hypothetical protein